MTLAQAWDVWRATRQGRAGISRRQQARLVDLVTFARAHSPYYRQLYAGVPPTHPDIRFRQLPPVTKADLMAHFDAWVTDPAVTKNQVVRFVADKSRVGELFLGKYLVFTTSGTSGTPAILLQDPEALAIYNAIGYVRGVAGRLSLGDAWRIAKGRAHTAGIFAVGGHFVSNSFMEYRLRQRPWRRNIQRLFSILDPLPQVVQELNAFQPVLIGAYASALNLLAAEQEAGRLHLRPVQINSSGETLTPEVRARVEKAFGCPVRDVYNASEVTGITFDCAEGRLHVNADWYILEPVDAAHQPVPPGQASYSVLVTNLANYIQPIIRYDLGDSVMVDAEPCPCGSPLPTIRVQGRTDEILAFSTDNGQTVHLLPMTIATVIEETAGVRRFQVIQVAPSVLSVRLEAAAPGDADRVWEAVERNLRAYLTGQGLTRVTVERSPDPPASNPRSGKFRHVWAEPGARIAMEA